MRSQRDQGSFGSRVARRVFVLFLACALLPTGVVGVFAWRRSSHELERAAREQLHRDSRSEGMALLSRLLVADGLLRVLGDASTQFLVAAPGAALFEAMPWRSVQRERAETLTAGPPTSLEREALAQGRSVLRTLPDRRLLLVRAPDAARPNHLVVAELDPAYLWTYESEADSALTIVDAEGVIVFSSLPAAAARIVVGAALPRLRMGRTAAASAEVPIAEPWLLFLASRFGSSHWYVVRSQSRAATFAPLVEFRRVFRWSVLLALLVVAALSSMQIRRTLHPIQQLARAAGRLGEGRWDTRAKIEAGDEFGELGRAFDGMAARIERHVQALASASAFGVALSAESSEERLIQLVLRALVDMTSSDSAAFLRPNSAGGLEVKEVLGSESGAVAGAAEAARLGEAVHRPASDAAVGASLALPLHDHEGRLAGVLQVSRPRDEHGGPRPHFLEAEVAAARSLASQASVALRNRALVDEFRLLFEGLIDLTVTALDEKSAYTGGHCRRVPILAELLADAVCRTREGTFARFEFSATERYELRIAALLHDFGKVVTPMHVMDKATKLETISDRIELVAARFAALQREAEVAWLRARLGEEGDGAAEAPGIAELREELAFLRTCNVGGEQMDVTAQERVRAIASRRWLDADGVRAPVLNDDEIENLTISRGTLNARERKVIEDHAALTIRLLGQLPFPPQLSGVPHIAGSHHERIDGHGYPLGLAGAEITLQGRLLGLADVFEALTAPDRPYRDPLSVSEALEELGRLVKRGHLDADLFDVFLRERVHLLYAREHLLPEQLDDATLEELARLPGGPLPAT